MLTHSRIDFLGLPLDTGVEIDDVCRLLDTPGKAQTVTFINPSAWAVAKRNPGYVDNLRQIDLVLPDGEGVAAACRWLTRAHCPRLSFDQSSLADPFFARAVRDGRSLMLIGGQPAIDEQMQAKLAQTYPDLKITGTAHGFGPFENKIAMVINNPPAAVIVAMGAPRQEEFLLALRSAGYQGVALTCGGFFDQYLAADDTDYYPDWINSFNLRFLWRFYKEPRRLWRRYLIDYQIFVGRAFLALVRRYLTFHGGKKAA